MKAQGGQEGPKGGQREAKGGPREANGAKRPTCKMAVSEASCLLVDGKARQGKARQGKARGRTFTLVYPDPTPTLLGGVLDHGKSIIRMFPPLRDCPRSRFKHGGGCGLRVALSCQVEANGFGVYYAVFDSPRWMVLGGGGPSPHV